ncbi:MAG: effector binding domain-containing protein [Flavobacteriaceae bacterium]|nr:effector binding domain-containing protein [Flavobacteriaceae bacterium]
MKFLKFLFFFILIAIIAGAMYLATLDGKYDVKRSKLIKASPEMIFYDLNDFKNWKDWGPWYEEDSTIVATYAKNTVGEGGSYSWIGKDGSGMMRTLKVDQPKRIDQEIVFKTPFGDMKSHVYWLIEKVEDGTNLTWGMKGEMGFFTRWMASSMGDEIGPMEEIGLEFFDKNIQKKILDYSVTTNGVVDLSGRYYLYTSTSSRIDEIEEKYPILLLKIYGFNKANNVKTTGGPFTLYHKYDEENGTTLFSVCYPVEEKMIAPKGSDILSGFMESGTYFKTTLRGSYENSKEAWETAMREVNNLEGYQMIENGEPYEEYLNNPHSTPNPADLITEIYIPVEKITNGPSPPVDEEIILEETAEIE